MRSVRVAAAHDDAALVPSADHVRADQGRHGLDLVRLPRLSHVHQTLFPQQL